MIVFVNPNAAGGAALSKWKKMERFLLDSRIPFSTRLLDGRRSALQLACDAFRKDERNFVAAGGDGTVNYLMNALIEGSACMPLENIRFGAIGLGSSNDFHKPFQPEQAYGGIPFKIDFDRACARDVGHIAYRDKDALVSRYFLVNASIGVTAKANDFFNNPDRVLKSLKRFHTASAIFYAAFKTIASHENLKAVVQSPEIGTIETELSNLGIAKSPHFSGSLRFNHSAEYDNGRFMVHLFNGMGRKGLLALLNRLSHGNLPANARSWSTSALTLTANKPFAVEFDGEVIHTTEAHFSILPRYIKVCP